MTITPDLKSAVENAGVEPVRIEDPESRTSYIVIREDVYQRLCEAIPESDVSLHEFEELIPAE
jgi:hypothetical protein